MVSRSVSSVLGRERRHHLDPVRRPAHEVQPRDHQGQPAAGADQRGHVRAAPVAGDVRQEHQREGRDEQQPAGDVAEPHRRTHAEHVERPHQHDEADPDQDGQREVEARARGRPRHVGEPLRLDERAGDQAVDGEHHRPADPVAEGGQRADQREVLAPRLVRVERDAAGHAREHARQLGVDVVLQRPEDDRDRPQDAGAGGAEGADGTTEPRDEEARVGERDHEAVPPRHRLQELPLLDLRNCHAALLLHPDTAPPERVLNQFAQRPRGSSR